MCRSALRAAPLGLSGRGFFVFRVADSVLQARGILGQFCSRLQQACKTKARKINRLGTVSTVDHCRRFDEYQGAEDPPPHSVEAHPQEPIGGMKPEAARALPPQDNQLMSQGDKLEFQRRSAAKPEREHGDESR